MPSQHCLLLACPALSALLTWRLTENLLTAAGAGFCLKLLQIGWHAAKPHAAPQEQRFPLSRTDVTLKEGRSAATYYGYMTLL